MTTLSMLGFRMASNVCKILSLCSYFHLCPASSSSSSSSAGGIIAGGVVGGFLFVTVVVVIVLVIMVFWIYRQKRLKSTDITGLSMSNKACHIRPADLGYKVCDTSLIVVSARFICFVCCFCSFCFV